MSSTWIWGSNDRGMITRIIQYTVKEAIVSFSFQQTEICYSVKHKANLQLGCEPPSEADMVWIVGRFLSKKQRAQVFLLKSHPYWNRKVRCQAAYTKPFFKLFYLTPPSSTQINRDIAHPQAVPLFSSFFSWLSVSKCSSVNKIVNKCSRTMMVHPVCTHWSLHEYNLGK